MSSDSSGWGGITKDSRRGATAGLMMAAQRAALLPAWWPHRRRRACFRTAACNPMCAACNPVCAACNPVRAACYVCGLQPHVLPQASIGPPVTLLDAMRCALMPVPVPPPSGAVAWGQAACGEVHSAHPTCNPVYPACNPTSTYPTCNPTYPARYLVCAHPAAA